MPTIKAGQKRLGTLREVSTSDSIDLGALYVMDCYMHPLSNLSDSILQRAATALVALDNPIDVTYAEIGPDGHVIIQGHASHASPILLIASAAILLLAGIGIALTVSHIYTVTDAVLAGGTLPGGAPGDSPGGAGGLPGLATLWSLVPLLAIIVGVYLFLKFRG